MALYIICYAFVIALGGYLCYFGGKGICCFWRSKAVGVEPIKMLAYGGDLVNKYSFACGVHGITLEDLTYEVIISTIHGAYIKFRKKGWFSSNM